VLFSSQGTSTVIQNGARGIQDIAPQAYGLDVIPRGFKRLRLRLFRIAF